MSLARSTYDIHQACLAETMQLSDWMIAIALVAGIGLLAAAAALAMIGS